MRPHRGQPTRLPSPWDSPDKNTGVGCHFLLQCVKVKSESEVAQLCPTQQSHGPQPTRLLHPRDFPGRSTGVGCHRLLRTQEWGYRHLQSISSRSEAQVTSWIYDCFWGGYGQSRGTDSLTCGIWRYYQVARRRIKLDREMFSWCLRVAWLGRGGRKNSHLKRAQNVKEANHYLFPLLWTGMRTWLDSS